MNILLDTITHNPIQTRSLAAELARSLKPNSILALYGVIGAGKTRFVQGLAQGLGVRALVNSPTYIIINEHADGRLPLFHADLYRLHSQDEVIDIGLLEYFERGGVTVIEWAERAENLLPDTTLHIHIEPVGRLKRHIVIKKHSLTSHSG